MRFFKTIHFLSLDVVLGAVSLHMMFYHALLHVWPQWEYDALLGISVYWVYGIDRQIDNLSTNASDELHTFHKQNQGKLMLILLMLACMNVYLLYRVEMAMVRLGLVLIFIVGGYWAAWANGLFGRLWGSKEFFTSLIYSAGVFLPTFLAGGVPVEWGIALFLLALLNLCLFTWIDSGGNNTFIQLLIWVGFAWLLVMCFSGFHLDVCFILLLIWGIHAGIYYFRPQMHMRPWAEWAFASPLIYVLCNL
jgi:hypothetical protein